MNLEGSLTPHDDDNDNDEDVLADPQHSAPNVTGCIAAKYCREVLSLPTRVSHLDSTFIGLLAKAYGDYYGMPNIIKFSSGSFQWCKKLSFLNPGSQRRHVFKVGDFIMERGKGDNEIVRINNILVHTWDNVRRVFVKGTLIKAGSLSASVDPVLGARVSPPPSPGRHK
jgi:hypothetical protein